MTAVPLFTSIPPSMSRKDEGGREIGPAYQEACIRSWIAAGFNPYSVNGPGDVVPFPDLVEVIRVPRTAKEMHGKSVVFIADMFAAANAVSTGPALITNADILLRPTFDLAGLAATLPEDGAAIAHRIDVARVDSTTGTPEYAGFDVFIAHTSRLARLPEGGFAIGIPWWDYFVPMALRAGGVDVHLLAEPAAYHLMHDLNWDEGRWIGGGVRYAQLMAVLLKGNDNFRHHADLAADAARKVTRAQSLAGIVAGSKSLSSLAGAAIEKAVRSPVRKALKKLSRDTISTINRDFSRHSMSVPT